MENMTPRQADVDRRLRDRVGLTLTDWLRAQRRSGCSYGAMSRRLFDLTGDSISYESLRTWCSRLEDTDEPKGSVA